MPTTNNFFETLLEQQKNIMETFTTNAKEAALTVNVDETMMEEGRKLFTEYAEKSRELTLESLKPATLKDWWDVMPTRMSKMLELNAEYYNKTLSWWNKAGMEYNGKNNQETFRKLWELAQKNSEVLVKSTTETAKTIKDFTN